MESAPSGGLLALIIISIILLACISAVVSAYETAITSITSYKWSNYVKTHNKQKKLTTKIVNHFQKNYSACLITILVANNIVAILVSNILFLALDQSIKNPAISSALNLLISGVLLLMLCEITPKTLARINIIRVLVYFAVVVYFFYILFWPITKLASIIFAKYEKAPPVSRRDVYFFIDEIEQNGLFTKEDGQLIKRTLIFDQVLVDQIMIKWNRVVYCYEGDPVKTIKEKFLHGQFSRMPVLDQTSNEVVGFIHLKDLFSSLEKSNEPFVLQELLYPAVLVSNTTPIKQALRQMRLHRAHLAVVQDKHHHTIGIVSMEDIIEELVREIYDEHDEVEAVQTLDNNTWLVLPNVKAAFFFNKWIKRDLVKSKNMTIQRYLASFENDGLNTQNKLETPWFIAEAIVDSENPEQIRYEIRKKSDVVD